VQELDVPTLNIAEVGQSLFERLRPDCSPPLSWIHEHVAYPPNLAGLLSLRIIGRCQSNATNYAYEISPPHSITSLLNSSTARGTVRPGILATEVCNSVILIWCSYC
jgi:hypothetical protein